MSLAAIVLAAGQGTRMKSALPKVLHEVAGRPMVAWTVQAALDAGAERVVVVVGHEREQVIASLSAHFDERVTTVVQHEQRGTGHAVAVGLSSLSEHDGRVLILYGDTPLLPTSALSALRRAAANANAPLSLLTAELPDPTGYGRILRDDEDRVIAIREHRDCSDEERAVREVNPGMYAVDTVFLRDAISKLSTDNAQGELYLTDVVEMAAKAGGAADVPWEMDDLRGVNDRWELAGVETSMRARILEQLARSGVTIRDPANTYVGAECDVQPDAILEPGVVLRGRTTIGAGTHLDVGCVLDDVRVAAGARLLPYTVATDSVIGEGAQVGPFSHLRPQSELGPETRIGNFVETKKTKLGRGSKANHLAYLGDGVIGENVNVGAGTIFCNYDGFQKHVTTLEDGAFIGSDSQLVAPITIGKGAYVATGTTVTLDVPADALAVGRARQKNKDGYASRLKARLAAAKKKAAKE